MRSGVTLSMIADADSFITCSGDPIKAVYDCIKCDDGSLDLVQSGMINTQSLIDSHAETCDMNYIIARLTAGDASVLNVRPTFYADVSGLQPDHRVAMDTLISAQNYFDALPIEQRAKFNNDFKTWFSSAGTPDWMQAMMPKPVQDNLQKSAENNSAAVADPVHEPQLPSQ